MFKSDWCRFDYNEIEYWRVYCVKSLSASTYRPDVPALLVQHPQPQTRIELPVYVQLNFSAVSDSSAEILTFFFCSSSLWRKSKKNGQVCQEG